MGAPCGAAPSPGDAISAKDRGAILPACRRAWQRVHGRAASSRPPPTTCRASFWFYASTDPARGPLLPRRMEPAARGTAYRARARRASAYYKAASAQRIGDGSMAGTPFYRSLMTSRSSRGSRWNSRVRRSIARSWVRTTCRLLAVRLSGHDSSPTRTAPSRACRRQVLQVYRSRGFLRTRRRGGRGRYSSGYHRPSVSRAADHASSLARRGAGLTPASVRAG